MQLLLLQAPPPTEKSVRLAPRMCTDAKNATSMFAFRPFQIRSRSVSDPISEQIPPRKRSECGELGPDLAGGRDGPKRLNDDPPHQPHVRCCSLKPQVSHQGPGAAQHEDTRRPPARKVCYLC
eukprot:990577-Prorocentrum_minimum.AAC.1